jgi:hypothetical protein
VSDQSANIALIDEMIGSLNAAEPEVFALMDYGSSDGWFARALNPPARSPDTHVSVR